MLTIRLTRVGKKNDPSFRVIVVDSHKKPKTGSYLEMVGSYDPRINRIDLKGERITYWMSMGATVSDTVHNLLVTKKIIDGPKINVLPKKTPPAKAEEKVEAAPASPVAAAEPTAPEAVEPEAAPAPVEETPVVVEETPAEEAPAQSDNSVATEGAAQ
jgi:small subunit ribosomal protein S16